VRSASLPQSAARRTLTPPEAARQIGVSADKILAWIKAGELRAWNSALRAGGRPRWRIDVADLAAFEASRAATAAPVRVRKRPAVGVTEYF
jgi:excisionase family DNA binding protein